MADSTFDAQQANQFLYWTDLHYIPEEQKLDPLWAAANLTFIKRNSHPLVDPATAQKFRDIDDGIINPTAYKHVFDPPDPDSKTGGNAEFVATDWKGNPIHIHINNIVETSIEKIPLNLFCRAIDEYAMLKQQKENQKILGRNQFTKFLNEMNAKMGFPKLGKNEDPFRYADNMAMNNSRPKTGAKPMAATDVPTTLLDSIKAAIDDNEDLALFNEFIYKGDVEIAIELGLKHYFEKNKFKRVGERLISDIRNFNKATVRWYTSRTTGRPIIEYLDPSRVHTGAFDEPDGRDMPYWFIEYDVTYGDFVKMFGKGRSKEELQKIFELNRNNQAAHGLDWNSCTAGSRNAARVRIGYCETQTQNCQVYAEGQRNGNLRFKEKPLDWYPKKNVKKEFQDKRVEKHYNVWYKFYYVPMKAIDVNVGVQMSDFIWQSNYIYDLGKVQDQQRYGDDDRNCLSSLVVWKRKGMTYAEIMDRFMPKIHLQWQKYQNYSSRNDEYTIFNNKLVESMMNLADEGDKKAATADKMQWLKMLVQTGMGMSDFVDEKGNQIDPVKNFSTGNGKAALDALVTMRELYGQMTTALAMSDVREGIDPKPRTSLGGIQLSLAASNNGTFFLEKGYMDMTIEVSNRILYYMNQIVREGDSDRLQEFKDVVGLANGMAMEAIKDIPMHRLGLFIDNVNTDQQKQYLVNLAEQMVKAGQLDIEALNLIIKVENYKYAAVLMIMKYKQKQRQIREDEARKQNYLMELKRADFEIVKQTHISKEEAKTISIDREKQWEQKIEQMKIELKSQSQTMIKDMIKNSRMEEATHKKGLENKDEQAVA